MENNRDDALSDAQPETFDPFEPHNLAIQQFILSARIYDVLYALLKEANPEKAKDLLKLHMGGNIVGPSPSFNGVFVTDEVNAASEYSEEYMSGDNTPKSSDTVD